MLRFTLLLMLPTLLSFKLSYQFLDLMAEDDYHFNGRADGNRQSLTIYSDSTFHLTVTDDSGSCWNWGEFGGSISITNDTIIFTAKVKPHGFYTKIRTINETYFYNSRSRNLYRISSKNFMAKTYRFKNWHFSEN